MSEIRLPMRLQCFSFHNFEFSPSDSNSSRTSRKSEVIPAFHCTAFDIDLGNT
jgi:hypothetical protein